MAVPWLPGWVAAKASGALEGLRNAGDYSIWAAVNAVSSITHLSQGTDSSAPVKPGSPPRDTGRTGGLPRVRSSASIRGEKDWGLPPHYEPVRLLGKGATCEAWLFRDGRSGAVVAVKLLRRPVVEHLLPNLLRELTLHSRLAWGHVNIVPLHDVLLSPRYVGIVMDAVEGGTLLHNVQRRWKETSDSGLYMSEDEARYFFVQLVSALRYCHRHGVAHRDVKLENVLLTQPGAQGQPPVVKLADFGAATLCTEEPDSATLFGTPPYMSPQLLDPQAPGHDARAADCWSAGVLLCAMLFGRFPFDHARRRDPATAEARLDIWVQQNLRTWSDLPELQTPLAHLSEACKELLNSLFQVDESARITTEQMLQHPWLQAPSSCPEYDEALRRLHEQQQALAGSASAGGCTMQAVGQDAELGRQIQQLIEFAAHHPGVEEGDEQMHIPLVRLGQQGGSPCRRGQCMGSHSSDPACSQSEGNTSGQGAEPARADCSGTGVSAGEGLRSSDAASKEDLAPDRVSCSAAEASGSASGSKGGACDGQGRCTGGDRCGACGERQAKESTLQVSC